jgi:hypothetical protein
MHKFRRGGHARYAEAPACMSSLSRTRLLLHTTLSYTRSLPTLAEGCRDFAATVADLVRVRVCACACPCARERRALLALACAALVCETKQAFCPGWSVGALGPRVPLRARPRAGARALECGFRDQLRKLNPFSQQSKSERLRRQWAERSTAVDVPGLEPSAPDASETKPPPSASPPANKSRLQDLLKLGTGTTKLQQELAARDAERMRAWSTPVPTKTAKLIFDSAGGEESAEDRRKRQEAAAKDMERVLGRKLLQQRAQEAAQPELDEAERREIAVRLVGREIAVQSKLTGLLFLVGVARARVRAALGSERRPGCSSIAGACTRTQPLTMAVATGARGGPASRHGPDAGRT